MVDGVGTTTWNYDALNRPLTITDPFTSTVSYVYDVLSNRTSLTYPDGKVVTNTYDALNRLIQVTVWNTQTTAYTYNALGQLITATLPNGITSNLSYNNAHRLESMTHMTSTATLASYTYTLDASGNRTQSVESVKQPSGSMQSETISYTYDSLYRLTAADYSDGQYFHYAYD